MTTIQRYALAFLTSIIFLGFTGSADATNLKFGRVISPKFPTMRYTPGMTVPISIALRNDSTFDAEGVLLYLAIRFQSGIFMRDTASVPFLKTRDSTVVTFEKQFAPLSAGVYEFDISIDYPFDVIPEDNKFSSALRLDEAPKGSFTFSQYDMYRPTFQMNSTRGLVTYDPGAAVDRLRLINIYGYPAGTTDSVWLIQNWPIMPFPTNDPMSIQVDWSKLGFAIGEDIDSVDLSITIEDTFTVHPLPYMLKDPYKVFNLNYDLGGVQLVIDDDDDSLKSGFRFRPPLTYSNPPVVTDSVVRGCNVPNLDLDSTTNNPGTKPGYTGDKNACVPTATANSMEWLESQHPEIRSGLTHREKLEEICKAMKRERETGVDDENFIKGKLAYIDKYKLPIRVKFQSEYIKQDSLQLSSPDPRYGHTAKNNSVDLPGDAASGPTVSSDYLIQEMKDSEDVEMNIGWFDSTGHWRYGHSAVVTGVYKINGQTKFVVKHDQDQMHAGGLIQETITFDTSEVVTTRTPEWDYFDPRYGPMKGYLTTIVSESYDPTVTFPSGGVRAERSPVKLRLVRNGSESLVAFELEVADRVEISLTDIGGRFLGHMAGRYLMSGPQRVDITPLIKSQPAGTYFLRVEGETVRGTLKVQR